MKPQDIPALYKKHGSLKAIARMTGANREVVRRHYVKAVELGLMEYLPLGGKTNSHLKDPTTKQRVKALKTTRDRHHTYILTCAQNNTLIHEKAFDNLIALADYKGAKVFVSTFLYSKRGLGVTNDKAQINPKDGSKRADRDEIWFDERVLPYLNNNRVEIAKGLVWCGELNILPTAEIPLSGMESYTGRASMVAPHVKIAMESIPTVGGNGAKLCFTTGTITLRNYIQRKAGFKGEFHHCYGALLVEVDDDGHWWARQLNADSDGMIHDLDLRVADGVVTEGNRVEAVTLGDTHVAELDPLVDKATFEPGGLIDQLAPKFMFVHDVLDMYSRGHHRMKDPYALLLRHVRGRESVEEEVVGVREFLKRIERPDCMTVVVDSNHDRHLDRWLRENDGRFDPVNALYWGRLNQWKSEYIAANHEEPNLLPLAITMNDPEFEDKHSVIFLGGDQSFIICKKHSNGIECGMHGDRGSNGAKGSLKFFSKMGRRSNVGHSHSAGILGGCYQSGTNSILKLEYNRGPSSWTHSDIITYPNGKRAIVTFFQGKWRA